MRAFLLGRSTGVVVMAIGLVACPLPLAAETGPSNGRCVPDGTVPTTPMTLTAAQLVLLDRLSGYWLGEGFGGRAEEWWSARDGDEMFGAFRGSHGGATDLYEFIKIELAAERPRMIIRHLDANAVPWVTEPVDTVFTLVGADDDCLLFDGVGYRFSGDAALTVIALIGGENPRSETLQFKRATQ